MFRTLCAVVRACRTRVVSAACSIGLFAVCGCIDVNLNPKDAPRSLKVPEIRRAYEAKEEIESQTAELNKLGQELDGIVTQVSYQVPTATGEAPKSQLIATIRGLRSAANALLEKAPRYVEAIDRLATGVRTGSRSFSGAAKLFETYAEDEPYEAIADDYRNIAKLFAELAVRCNNAQQEIANKYDRDAFLETLRYVRQQELLLDRLLSAAECLFFEDPDALELRRYMAELDSYTRNYEAFRVQIRDLNRVIPMLQPTPAAPSEKPATDAPAEPATIDSHDANQNVTVSPRPNAAEVVALTSTTAPISTMRPDPRSEQLDNTCRTSTSDSFATSMTDSDHRVPAVPVERRFPPPRTRSLAK